MDLLETFLYRQNPERYVQEILKVLGLSVKELMNTELITAEEETPAGELALIMLERDIDRIPILLEGKCIGVVGREDIIQAIAQLHMDEKSFSS
jgi:CBS domain-containing protein